jgi:hypothetical protein
VKVTFCVPCKATNEIQKFCPTLFSSQTFDLQALFSRWPCYIMWKQLCEKTIESIEWQGFGRKLPHSTSSSIKFYNTLNCSRSLYSRCLILLRMNECLTPSISWKIGCEISSTNTWIYALDFIVNIIFYA